MEEDEMSYDGSKKDSVKADKEMPKTFKNGDGVDVYNDFWARSGMGLVYFFIGAGLSIICFEFMYWIMSHFETPYIIKSGVALAFSVLVITGWDKVTGEKPTLMKAPITFFSIIIFVLSLFIGYSQYNGTSSNGLEDILWVYKKADGSIVKCHDDNNNDNKKTETPSETLTLSSPNAFAITKRKFHYGDNLKVKISGSAVKLNSTILSPGGGEYNIPVLGNDFIVFNGTSNTPAIIEVYY